MNKNLILLIVLAVGLMYPLTVFCQGFEDFCIDPGHGGPGANKYCYNRVG